jgi:hypothetical protein
MAAKSMLWVCSTLPQFLAELSQEWASHRRL